MNGQHTMDAATECSGTGRAETRGARASGRRTAWGGLAWTGAMVLVVTAALVLQTARLHSRDADLNRRETALAEMKDLVTQLKATNDAREKRLHEVADNLEAMYQLMQARTPAPQDPGLQRAGHVNNAGGAPLPDLAPTGR